MPKPPFPVSKRNSTADCVTSQMNIYASFNLIKSVFVLHPFKELTHSNCNLEIPVLRPL